MPKTVEEQKIQLPKALADVVEGGNFEDMMKAEDVKTLQPESIPIDDSEKFARCLALKWFYDFLNKRHNQQNSRWERIEGHWEGKLGYFWTPNMNIFEVAGDSSDFEFNFRSGGSTWKPKADLLTTTLKKGDAITKVEDEVLKENDTMKKEAKVENFLKSQEKFIELVHRLSESFGPEDAAKFQSVTEAEIKRQCTSVAKCDVYKMKKIKEVMDTYTTKLTKNFISMMAGHMGDTLDTLDKAQESAEPEKGGSQQEADQEADREKGATPSA
jgi:hypothetical protein